MSTPNLDHVVARRDGVPSRILFERADGDAHRVLTKAGAIAAARVAGETATLEALAARIGRAHLDPMDEWDRAERRLRVRAGWISADLAIALFDRFGDALGEVYDGELTALSELLGHRVELGREALVRIDLGATPPAELEAPWWYRWAEWLERHPDARITVWHLLLSLDRDYADQWVQPYADAHALQLHEARPKLREFWAERAGGAPLAEEVSPLPLDGIPGPMLEWARRWPAWEAWFARRIPLEVYLGVGSAVRIMRPEESEPFELYAKATLRCVLGLGARNAYMHDIDEAGSYSVYQTYPDNAFAEARGWAHLLKGIQSGKTIDRRSRYLRLMHELGEPATTTLASLFRKPGSPTLFAL